MSTSNLPAEVSPGTYSRIAAAAGLTFVTDGLFAVVLSIGFFDSSFSALWKGVASVLIGRSALEGGAYTTALGVVMHFMVALTWSTIFVAIVLRWERVRRVLLSPFGVLKVAAVYGPLIWLVMWGIVIPVLAGRAPSPITSRWWVQFLGHVPFVGLPLVWASSRSWKP